MINVYYHELYLNKDKLRGIKSFLLESELDLKSKASRLVEAAEEFNNDISGASFDLEDARGFWAEVAEAFVSVDDLLKDMIETDENYVEEEE